MIYYLLHARTRDQVNVSIFVRMVYYSQDKNEAIDSLEKPLFRKHGIIDA
jgi:hypothetical protein